MRGPYEIVLVMRSEIGTGYYRLAFAQAANPGRVAKLVESYFSNESRAVAYANASSPALASGLAAASTPAVHLEPVAAASRPAVDLEPVAAASGPAVDLEPVAAAAYTPSLNDPSALSKR